MAVRDGFWNSMVGDVRTYYNTDFSHILSLLIKDGVYQNYGQALITIPGEGLQVIVQQGEAWFDEHWIRNDSDLQVAIDTAPIVAGYSRIDAIAIKVDSTPSLEGRHVTIDYIPGTGATEPVMPELVDTDLIKYHLLCTVTVPANATSITQANITNYIGTETTPFISGILETVDASVLLAQWSAQFTEFMQDNETDFNTWMSNQQNVFTNWFESIRDQLDEDAAGHLQLEINDLKKGTGVFYDTDAEAEADIDNIEEGAIVYTNDGISRKENGSLVKKAGRVLVDLALSLTSNNAVANRVVTQNLNQKVTKFSGTDSGNTYVTVDQLAYDETNKKLGLKVNGADTVIPFSGGGAKLVGTYTNSATINVSSYGATSVDQFVCAFTGSQQQVSDGGNSFEGSGAVYGWAKSTFTPPSLSLNGDYLRLTIGTAVAQGGGGTWPTHTATIKMPVKIYYVGDIS